MRNREEQPDSTLYLSHRLCLGLPQRLSNKNPPANRRRRRHRFNPWVRKIPWRRKWQPIQYSCRKTPMDSRAWWPTVQRVAERQLRLIMLVLHLCKRILPIA